MTASYEYLVLGSGIAGLYAALLAAQHGRTAVVTKGPIEESNTKYAQGGIAAAVGRDDTPAAHLADTLKAGDGLCDRHAVDILVREAPDRIRKLAQLGVPFDTQGGEVALSREAAHSLPRILHAGGDRTGNAIETVMVEQVRAADVDVFDRHCAVEIIVEAGRAAGVRTLDAAGQARTIAARWIILATGGAGRLYTLTTNPPVATSDGIALAFRAGATLRDMEFVQFHPTALRLPGAPAFLLTEALRGESAVLRSVDGRRFMPGYHADAELAPRDVVARAIAAEMRTTGSDHVLLDITHRDAQFVAARFPGVYQHCLQYELDITRHAVPVAPAAHYMMGGVATDDAGRTTLPGLLACGEVANTGVHGANRLASNSLLETVVFAQRAVEATLDSAGPASLTTDAEPLDFPATLAAPDVDTLQSLLWQHAGIVRDRDGLQAAAATIDSWATAPVADGAPAEARQSEAAPSETAQPEAALSDAALANMALVGRLIVAAALRRQEGRGAHYRSDFPEKSEAWRRHLSFRRAAS